VAYPENQYDEAIILDLRDQAVVADAVSPEFSKAFALQGVSQFTGIFEPSDSRIEIFPNAALNRVIEFL
jgi:hypothetical protein